jgi:hypothetical protein
VDHDALERQQQGTHRHSAPRRASGGGTVDGVLALQRSAGNAAVASMVGAQRLPETAPEGVQRAVHIDEVETTTSGAAGPSSAGGAASTPAGAAAAGAGATGAAAGAPTDLGEVATVGTLIARNAVVSPSYTPGAGNIW